MDLLHISALPMYYVNDWDYGLLKNTHSLDDLPWYSYQMHRQYPGLIQEDREPGLDCSTCHLRKGKGKI